MQMGHNATAYCRRCILSQLRFVTVCDFLNKLNSTFFTVAFCRCCILSFLRFVTFAFCRFCVLSLLCFVAVAFCHCCVLSLLRFVAFAFCRFCVHEMNLRKAKYRAFKHAILGSCSHVSDHYLLQDSLFSNVFFLRNK